MNIMLIDSELIERMRTRMKNYMLGPLREADWDNARRLVKFLSIFYDVTLKFSSSKFVIASNYLNEMWKVQIHLKSLDDSDYVLLSCIVKPIIAKFVKYQADNLEKVNMLLILAAIVDPQCKWTLLHSALVVCMIPRRWRSCVITLKSC